MESDLADRLSRSRGRFSLALHSDRKASKAAGVSPPSTVVVGTGAYGLSEWGGLSREDRELLASSLERRLLPALKGDPGMTAWLERFDGMRLELTTGRKPDGA